MPGERYQGCGLGIFILMSEDWRCCDSKVQLLECLFGSETGGKKQYSRGKSITLITTNPFYLHVRFYT